jgi:hypothetical protein
MILDDYRWQDHLSTPARSRADLAIAIVVLAVLSVASAMSEAHDASGSVGASDTTSKQLLIGRAATTSRLEVHDKISARSGALQ